jgi:hypothetical protein
MKREATLTLRDTTTPFMLLMIGFFKHVYIVTYFVCAWLSSPCPCNDHLAPILDLPSQSEHPPLQTSRALFSNAPLSTTRAS